jgi:hypothetical protein
MYDTMAVWETDAALAAQSDLMSDFANVWQAADKVVYSTTLAAVPTANTRLERHFDLGVVHDLKADAPRRAPIQQRRRPPPLPPSVGSHVRLDGNAGFDSFGTDRWAHAVSIGRAQTDLVSGGVHRL